MVAAGFAMVLLVGPVEPLDGAAVAKGTGSVVALAVVGTGTLLLVGLI